MLSSLRVVLDGGPLLPSSGPGGVGRWTEQVVRSLAVSAPDWRLFVIAHGRKDERISAAFPPNVDLRIVRWSPRKQRALSLLGVYPDIEEIAGPVDAMVGSAFVTWPASHAAEIPVIHDLAFLRTPRFVARRNLLYLRRMVPRSLARSSVVVAVSEALRAEISDEEMGVHADSIDVVPGGYEAVPARPPPWAAEVPSRFILSVATVEPRKNLGGILDAHRILAEEGHDPPPLVIAGMRGWRRRSLDERLRASVRSGSAVYLGPVVEPGFLAWLYERASAFVFPSFYEGFGLPVLEAAAHGCPLVISDLAPLREIVGDAAVFVDPRDARSIATGIKSALVHGREHARVGKARERAQTQTWTRSAEAMRAAIARAVRLKRSAVG